MRALSAEALAALDSRAIRARDFVWFTVKARDTGNPFSVGYWSDVGTITAQVLDPETQAAQARAFQGAASLISIGGVALSSNLAVQTVSINLSQVGAPNDLVRTYEAKQGRVEVYRGLFEPQSYVQIGAAIPRFVGYIDSVEITTPSEGAEGSITLSCLSHTQELTRANAATRSVAYQQQRSPSDTFRRHAATVGGWDLRWGTASE